MADSPITDTDLRKSEEKFRKLVELSVQGVSVIQDFRLVYANQAYAHIHGFESVAELMAAGSWMERIPAFGRDEMEQRYRARKAGTAVPGRYERQGIRKDSSLVWLDVSTRVIDWEGDTAWLATMLDITERKRAEEELRASQQLLRTLVDSLPEAIFVKDRERRYRLVNARMAEAYGLAQDEFAGRRSEELSAHLELERAEWIRASDREVLEQGKPAELPEFKVRTESGEILWYRIAKLPLRNEKGEVIGLVGMREDITARKRSEEARLALERLSQHAQSLESLSEMAGGIAHDFSNLLQTMLGYAELALLDLPQDSPLRQPLEMIGNAGNKAVALTQQMLTLSGRSQFALEALDLNQLIASALPKLRELLPAGATLRVVPSGDIPRVLADPILVTQVLHSLARNACEAMPADCAGEIVLATGVEQVAPGALEESSSDAGMAGGLFGFFEVRDNGPGVPQEVMARLFEPFHSTKFLGRGIGLAAVRGIVRGHRGMLKVQSEPGAGASFKVLLPTAPEELGRDR